MIVYVVTAGEHDDYHIEGIFTTLPSAVSYINNNFRRKKHPQAYSPAIEEWAIDDPAEDPRPIVIHWDVY